MLTIQKCHELAVKAQADLLTDEDIHAAFKACKDFNTADIRDYLGNKIVEKLKIPTTNQSAFKMAAFNENEPSEDKKFISYAQLFVELGRWIRRTITKYKLSNGLVPLSYTNKRYNLKSGFTFEDAQQSYKKRKYDSFTSIANDVEYFSTYKELVEKYNSTLQHFWATEALLKQFLEAPENDSFTDTLQERITTCCLARESYLQSKKKLQQFTSSLDPTKVTQLEAQYNEYTLTEVQKLIATTNENVKGGNEYLNLELPYQVEFAIPKQPVCRFYIFGRTEQINSSDNEEKVQVKSVGPQR